MKNPEMFILAGSLFFRMSSGKFLPAIPASNFAGEKNEPFCAMTFINKTKPDAVVM
jgi:hypothetical protein